jgi:NADPH-dependent curcumin reductase CurA
MLQGMTAHYLSYDTYPLKRGETVLIHAAAGGVGQLLTQMAHNIGARVIGTVSTEEKAKLAREAGAEEVILYSQVDFETETKRLTNDKGVHVVYDGVGKRMGSPILVSLGFQVRRSGFRICIRSSYHGSKVASKSGFTQRPFATIADRCDVQLCRSRSDLWNYQCCAVDH